MLYYLGTQYLGLTSLFTSILGMLNLAELGFSSAVVYSMYKPISENNTDEICALLSFYKKVYRIIGITVLGAGLCVTPFLPLLIEGTWPEGISLSLVFLIELVNVSVSYFFFGYRESLLQAHQRTDVTSKVTMAVRSARYLLQILILVVTRNFYLYVIITPISTVLVNYINYRVSLKYYPQYICAGVLGKDKKADLKHQVGGLMISKVCGVTRNGLDSIVLSAFLGLSVVAIYSNYYYILNSVHGILCIIGVSMRAGVGNSIAADDVKKNYLDLRKFTFLYALIAGVCTCCMVGLYQPFMRLWVGEENTFPFYIMILFPIYFYLLTTTDMRNVYIDATGIWWQNKKRPIIETIVNLILNIGLGKLFGVVGILMATIISLSIINIGYGSKVLFEEYFKGEKMSAYFAEQGLYALAVAVSAAMTIFLCRFVPFTGIAELIVKGILSVGVSTVLLLLAFFRYPLFRYVRELVGIVLKRRR